MVNLHFPSCIPLSGNKNIFQASLILYICTAICYIMTSLLQWWCEGFEMHFAQSELVYHRGMNAKKSGTYGNQAARFFKFFFWMKTWFCFILAEKRITLTHIFYINSFSSVTDFTNIITNKFKLDDNLLQTCDTLVKDESNVINIGKLGGRSL